MLISLECENRNNIYKLITGVMANAIVEANGGKLVDYTSDAKKEENEQTK